MHLGPNMRQVRGLHGKSLKDVADRIGIDESQLSRIEREQGPVMQKTLKAWLRVFFMEESALRRGYISCQVFSPVPEPMREGAE